MGLLTETNAQYYAGEQLYTGTAVNPQALIWPAGMTPLIWDTTATPTSIPNFKVYIDNIETVGTYTLASTTSVGVVVQTITLNVAVALTSVISVRLISESIWDNYGSYSYVTLIDIVNNFMVAYVGMDKIIPRVKRSDVVFHAKRGLQEFSYDTLKSVKSQELTIPPSLSVIIPQDYVNYVQVSRIDNLGVKHIIYPTTLTSNPYTVPLQDADGTPTQDNFGNMLQGNSITNDRWDTTNDNLLTGAFNTDMYNAGVYGWTWEKVAWGQRYGLDPETSQTNGWFTINEREGKFSFSSNLAGQLIILEYISDGLSSDLDTRVPKMAEEALYMHLVYSIIAGRSNVPEHIVQRYKKDRRAQLRNAKIRLSNIKLEEFTQIMRGKSKWIKH
jgi:hypothetical protein